MEGREALLKLPVQSMDPATVWTLSKPPMVRREVSFAMRKVPPMLVSWGKDKFVRDVQLTKDRELTMEVKLGAEMEVNEVVKKPMSLVTLLRELMLMDWMLRKVMFWAVRRAGNETVV